MVILGCVSAFLVLVSSPLYVLVKKGGNVVGFPQSQLLSGRLALKILCLVAVEEAVEHDQGVITDLKKCVLSAETRCLQGIGNKPPRKPEKCLIS